MLSIHREVAQLRRLDINEARTLLEETHNLPWWNDMNDLPSKITHRHSDEKDTRTDNQDFLRRQIHSMERNRKIRSHRYSSISPFHAPSSSPEIHPRTRPRISFNSSTIRPRKPRWAGHSLAKPMNVREPADAAKPFVNKVIVVPGRLETVFRDSQWSGVL